MRNILIADDNDEIREIVRILLESEGFNVSEAINGEDAVNKVNDNTDLIILDIMMPIKSGFKACIEIRKKQAHLFYFLLQSHRILINVWLFLLEAMIFFQNHFHIQN